MSGKIEESFRGGTRSPLLYKGDRIVQVESGGTDNTKSNPNQFHNQAASTEHQAEILRQYGIAFGK